MNVCWKTGRFVIRRRALAFTTAAFLLVSAQLFAQPKDPSRKLTSDESKEFQNISTLLSGTQSPANDLNVAWVGSDLLKAQSNKAYVPFTISFDSSKSAADRLLLYWRVSPAANCGDAPTAMPAAPAGKAKAAPVSYAFENFHTLMLPKGRTTQRISRSFVVCPGVYELTVLVKEPTPKKRGEVARSGFLKRSITVPDLWSSELNTSSVIVADHIDPLAAPLTPAQLEERPYALGRMEITPALDTRFTKKNELSVFLLIYNSKLNESNAPDVTVEYNFYALQNGTEKFFNKTNPQNLNAQTVPEGFDPTAGLTNGQTVPLASFPEGDYRLEIKITDKLATKTITRDVKFSVAGS
jgi:hypothetical protein